MQAIVSYTIDSLILTWQGEEEYIAHNSCQNNPQIYYLLSTQHMVVKMSATAMTLHSGQTRKLKGESVFHAILLLQMEGSYRTSKFVSIFFLNSRLCKQFLYVCTAFFMWTYIMHMFMLVPRSKCTATNWQDNLHCLYQNNLEVE